VEPERVEFSPSAASFSNFHAPFGHSARSREKRRARPFVPRWPSLIALVTANGNVACNRGIRSMTNPLVDEMRAM